MDPYNDPLGGAVEGGRGTSTRHATDWGLAALLLALALMMLFPISLGVLAVGFDLIARTTHPNNMRWVNTVADVSVYSFIGLSVLAALFGLVGLISGFARNQPVGLPTAGLLVSIVALILWVVMAVVVGVVKSEMPNYQNNRMPMHMWRDFKP